MIVLNIQFPATGIPVVLSSHIPKLDSDHLSLDRIKTAH